RRIAQGPHPQEREDGVSLSDVQAANIELVGVAAAQRDDLAAWLLADRAGPGREADQLGEALGAGLVEDDAACALAHRHDSLGAESRERLADGATRDRELLHQLALRRQLGAALIRPGADGAAQSLCDGAMTRLFSGSQDVHTRYLAYRLTTINNALCRRIPV